MSEHVLEIQSLADARARCSCKRWRYHGTTDTGTLQSIERQFTFHLSNVSRAQLVRQDKMRKDYKERWYTRGQVALIADHLRAVYKLDHDDLHVEYLLDAGKNGAYGANIQSKLLASRIPLAKIIAVLS